MATTVYGEFNPATQSGMQILWNLAIPVSQFALSNTILGLNPNTGTNNLNQQIFTTPLKATVKFVTLNAWTAAPTAGTITLTVAGTTLSAVNGTSITLTTPAVVSTNITITANTRQVVSGTSASWAQGANSGICIQVWGYLG